MFYKIKFKLYKRKWRKKNKNNYTVPNYIIPIDIVKIGNYTYGPISCVSDNAEYKLIIGNYCSIAQDVLFLLAIDHYTNHISTYPFIKMVCNGPSEAISKGNIVVDDDVWIGARAIILSGVHIGQGAIVAAGAVVSKDVPPYAIVGGVPAKVIKYRFEPEMIKELLKIDYGKLTKEQIQSHIDELYEQLKDTSQLGWMEKKKEK